jgi:hypothetical protein
MADKPSDKEIERRKQQAALKAAAPKPHENFMQSKGGKSGPKPAKARIQRHQGR